VLDKDEELLIQRLGERIRELRIKKGYSSQETFAYDAGIPRAQYGRYEKGRNITMTSLYQILKFHKLTLPEFFGEGFEDVHKKLKK
jgi:transcriptional regulator with XRE-family HTH domain